MIDESKLSISKAVSINKPINLKLEISSATPLYVRRIERWFFFFILYKTIFSFKYVKLHIHACWACNKNVH